MAVILCRGGGVKPTTTLFPDTYMFHLENDVLPVRSEWHAVADAVDLYASMVRQFLIHTLEVGMEWSKA